MRSHNSDAVDVLGFFERRHADDAAGFVPYDEFIRRPAALSADRNTPIAIHCHRRNVSAIAAPELAALGFSDIVDLDGGMNAWVPSGRTLIRTP